MKEVAYYEKEVLENEAKLEEMKAKNQDKYDIKKFQEVLDESYMMIPDSKSRLAKVLEEMEGFLAAHADTEGLPVDQLDDAKKLLAEAGIVV